MTQSIANLTDNISPQLRQVESLFNDELYSDLDCVNTLVQHVARFRGKMLRPMLVLLTGQAAGKLTPDHITIATVVEMVHMATLVHDDVLDEAELRRKGATINHLKGNEAAVMLGDYLISHSYHLCSGIESQMAARVISRTTNEVSEGELLQLHNRGNLDLDEETYITIITRKTARLIAASCYLGAKLAGADEPIAAALEKYGQSLGIAFQIQDDILDLVGSTNVVGKTLGIDLEKCKLTLPIIHFLKTAPQEHRDLCRSLLNSKETNQTDRIRNLILPSGSIDYAKDRAKRLIVRAQNAISILPDTEAKRTLSIMADFVLARAM